MNYKLIILLSGLAMTVFNTTAAEILRHNPFEQPEGLATNDKSTTTARLELRGTVMDGDDSMADIDGEYYRINQEVSGYRVVRIESGSVTLSRSGDEKILTLHNNE